MNRRRPIVCITLSSEAIARLDAMATLHGVSRSAMIERLVREKETSIEEGRRIRS
jgi:hypothetical protein